MQSSVQSIQRSQFAAGLALAIIGSILFSAKAVIVKLAYRYGVDAATLLTLRMALSLPFFIVALAWSSRGAQPLAHRPYASDFHRTAGLLRGKLSRFPGPAIRHGGARAADPVSEPNLVVVLSSFVLRKHFGRYEWGALALCYGGILLVFWHDASLEGGQVLLGSGLVFASAVCYAIYLIMSGELVRGSERYALRLTQCAYLASQYLHNSPC